MTTTSYRGGGIRRSLPRPDNHIIVLFGATGDLARRKLLPGLYHLFAAGLLPEGCRIVGTARRALASEQFRVTALAEVPQSC
jgi:glucose-6-phosphate 1-dehydrogenase